MMPPLYNTLLFYSSLIIFLCYAGLCFACHVQLVVLFYCQIFRKTVITDFCCDEANILQRLLCHPVLSGDDFNLKKKSNVLNKIYLPLYFYCQIDVGVSQSMPQVRAKFGSCKSSTVQEIDLRFHI